ncbi:MAG TPA: hypothetical protein PK995_06935 [Bacteroidia bacterium]|nr:hypothetical protein [Bacteroidia bacterium]
MNSFKFIKTKKSRREDIIIVAAIHELPQKSIRKIAFTFVCRGVSPYALTGWEESPYALTILAIHGLSLQLRMHAKENLR